MDTVTIFVGNWSPELTGWATFTSVDGVYTWSKTFLSWSVLGEFQLSDHGRSMRTFTGPTQESVLTAQAVYGASLNRAVGQLVLSLYEPPPGWSVARRIVLDSQQYIVVIVDTPGLPLPPTEFEGGAAPVDAPRGLRGPVVVLTTAALPVACQPSGSGVVVLTGGRNVAAGPADFYDSRGVVMRPEYTHASGHGEFRPVAAPGTVYAVALDDSPPLLFRVPSCCSRLELSLDSIRAGVLTSGYGSAQDWRLRGSTRLGRRGLSGMEDIRQRSRDAAAQTEFILGRTEI